MLERDVIHEADSVEKAGYRQKFPRFKVRAPHILKIAYIRYTFIKRSLNSKSAGFLNINRVMEKIKILCIDSKIILTFRFEFSVLSGVFNV